VTGLAALAKVAQPGPETCVHRCVSPVPGWPVVLDDNRPDWHREQQHGLIRTCRDGWRLVFRSAVRSRRSHGAVHRNCRRHRSRSPCIGSRIDRRRSPSGDRTPPRHHPGPNRQVERSQRLARRQELDVRGRRVGMTDVVTVTPARWAVCPTPAATAVRAVRFGSTTAPVKEPVRRPVVRQRSRSTSCARSAEWAQLRRLDKASV